MTSLLVTIRQRTERHRTYRTCHTRDYSNISYIKRNERHIISHSSFILIIPKRCAPQPLLMHIIPTLHTHTHTTRPSLIPRLYSSSDAKLLKGAEQTEKKTFLPSFFALCAKCLRWQSHCGRCGTRYDDYGI